MTSINWLYHLLLFDQIYSNSFVMKYPGRSFGRGSTASPTVRSNVNSIQYLEKLITLGTESLSNLDTWHTPLPSLPPPTWDWSEVLSFDWPLLLLGLGFPSPCCELGIFTFKKKGVVPCQQMVSSQWIKLPWSSYLYVLNEKLDCTFHCARPLPPPPLVCFCFLTDTGAHQSHRGPSWCKGLCPASTWPHPMAISITFRVFPNNVSLKNLCCFGSLYNLLKIKISSKLFQAPPLSHPCCQKREPGVTKQWPSYGGTFDATLASYWPQPHNM